MPSISFSRIWGPLVRLGWLSSKSQASSWLLLPPIELQAHQPHQAGILIWGWDSALMLGDKHLPISQPRVPFSSSAALPLPEVASSCPPVFPNPAYWNYAEWMCPRRFLQEPSLSALLPALLWMPALSILSPDPMDSLSGLEGCKLVNTCIFLLGVILIFFEFSLTCIVYRS